MNKKELDFLYIYLFVLLCIVVFFSIVVYFMYMQNVELQKTLQNDHSDQNEQNTISIKRELDINPVKDPIYPVEGIEFQQLGTLSSIESGDQVNPIVLPLYGKRKYRDRWTYYTISNNDKNLRIEVEFENRGCMKDNIGCDMIYDGSTVKIPVYNNKEFKVSLYNTSLF